MSSEASVRKILQHLGHFILKQTLEVHMLDILDMSLQQKPVSLF